MMTHTRKHTDMVELRQNRLVIVVIDTEASNKILENKIDNGVFIWIYCFPVTVN